MSVLVVGFDSAWTAKNSGSIVGALQSRPGECHHIGLPLIANYQQATQRLLDWQAAYRPDRTIVLLDQPTIVVKSSAQRPVEHIVSPVVSRRRGGMQPSNTGQLSMFGPGAPVWTFLNRFGGAANPLDPATLTQIYETYPVLSLIALGWLRPDSRPMGRLPKYNPDRPKTFSLNDWKYVCDATCTAISAAGLPEMAQWLAGMSLLKSPRKADQDRLDACLCLLTAFAMANGKECLMVGDMASGYIVVPFGGLLFDELRHSCAATGRDPDAWVRSLRLIV